MFTVQSVAPGKDGYRHALWTVPTDDSAPASRLTIGAKHDRHPRFSPDGRTLAFLSDRRLAVEELPGAPDDREDGVQVHLLPVDGPGEARRLTDLPRGVDGFAWSPDGRSLAVLSASRGTDVKEDARRRGKTEKPEPGAPPPSDYHYIDRLQSMFNGAGFIYGQVPQLWIVDASTGEARRLTDLPSRVEAVAWSPDGKRLAFATNLAGDRDLGWHSDVHVVDVAIGPADPGHRRARLLHRCRRGCRTDGRWPPSATAIPAAAGSRADIWLFRADGSESGPRGGRNLSARHDLMPGSGMNSDVTIGEEPRLVATGDGRSLLFSAPVEGAYELWRIHLGDGDVERLTAGHHYLSGWDAVPGRAAGSIRVAVLRSAPTELPDVHLLDVPARRIGRPLELRRLTELNRDALAGIALVEPETRWTTVDGSADPGLARRRPPIATGRVGPPAGRRRSCSRSTVARTRSTAGPRRGSSSAWPVPGSASGTPTRAGPRATARRSTPQTTGTGATGRPATACPGSRRSSPAGSPTRIGSA